MYTAKHPECLAKALEKECGEDGPLGHLEVGRGRQELLLVEAAEMEQGKRGWMADSVRGRAVWQWTDRKTELRRPRGTEGKDLAQSWVTQWLLL